MGTRLHNWIYLRRLMRLRRAFSISSFTIFLLGFGLCYWMFNMFTTVTMVECEYAISWLHDWERFRSGIQLVGLTIVFCFCILVLRILILNNLNPIETAMQLVFIVALLGAFLAHKAFLFPFGMPGKAEMEWFSDNVLNRNYQLLEETTAIEPSPFLDWAYDYPRPPFERQPERPSLNRDINLPLTKIFISEQSPTKSEFGALRACYVNYRDAEKQFQKDIKRWDDYMVGFERWRAANEWRYVRTPPSSDVSEISSTDE